MAHHLADFGGCAHWIVAALRHTLPTLLRAVVPYKWAAVMGKHGEKKMFVNPPLTQLCKMQVLGDGLQIPTPTPKNRRAFAHVPVLPPAPIALRPALGLKAGMEFTAVMQEGEHREARNMSG